jgi:hypothetical protein
MNPGGVAIENLFFVDFDSELFVTDKTPSSTNNLCDRPRSSHSTDGIQCLILPSNFKFYIRSYATLSAYAYTRVGQKSAFSEFILLIAKILFIMHKKKFVRREKFLGRYLRLLKVSQFKIWEEFFHVFIFIGNLILYKKGPYSTLCTIDNFWDHGSFSKKFDIFLYIHTFYG